MNRLSAAMAACAFVVAASMAGGGVASAHAAATIGNQQEAPTASADSSTPTFAVPMYIVGFDTQVAEAHGFRIVTRNGVTQSVADNGGSVGPDNLIGGDCGYAWLFLSGEYLAYYFYTGFHVDSPAIDYNWNVDVFGPYSYQRNLQRGGGLLFRTDWEAYGSIPVDDPGFYAGSVVPESSFAILDNGGVCYAAYGIEDTANVDG